MSNLAEQVAEKLEGFPIEQQQEVLNFVEFLEAKLKDHPNAERDQPKPRISFQESIRKYSGCIDGGPVDLSTNKAYMEGFGEV
jgi:hypothetical protein